MGPQVQGTGHCRKWDGEYRWCIKSYTFIPAIAKSVEAQVLTVVKSAAVRENTFPAYCSIIPCWCVSVVVTGDLGDDLLLAGHHEWEKCSLEIF